MIVGMFIGVFVGIFVAALFQSGKVQYPQISDEIEPITKGILQ
jgi:uncharacterized membrane protein YgaE (UPF0421/DUF939 family)